MKKVLVVLGIALCASSSFAAQMECGLGVMTATAGGLMPTEKPTQLKSVKVQLQGDLSLKGCSENTVEDLKITFCALEDSEAQGVYSAQILVEDKNEKDKDSLNFTSGSNLLALPKKGTVLVNLQSTTALSPIFAKKMEAAKLEFPDYKGGDSLQIDEAVSQGVKYNAIKAGEIVAVSLDSCVLK